MRDGRRARRLESGSRRRRTAPRRCRRRDGGGDGRRGGASCARSGRRRSATVSVSVLDDGRIAVRAHRTPVPQGCGDLPRHARPHIPKTAGVACTGVPGQRWPAQTGEAGAQRWTAPDGGRVRGLGGVGEKGNGGGTTGCWRCGRAAEAGAGEAMGCRCGIRRPGVPHARRRMSRAMFGSGHCLQSRISHDSFLVGYDWVNRVVGVAVPRSLDSESWTLESWTLGSWTCWRYAARAFGACIARLLRRCRGPAMAIEPRCGAEARSTQPQECAAEA